MKGAQSRGGTVLQAKAWLEEQRLGLASQAGDFRLDESRLTAHAPKQAQQPPDGGAAGWAQDGEWHSDDDFDAGGGQAVRELLRLCRWLSPDCARCCRACSPLRQAWQVECAGLVMLSSILG